ncbi:hypothetical protein BV25DRAFT_1843410 [Artomyces pyxidatus]|uniref:Uncharacterized protein n=1 Tax=Artomyces pyxidatus TaxID=48021 RepID=A0ACB8SGG8_9AGAM|nr:hypothetical protein BV25DRAFT_1843410 [Artomyces pyxidatus]
MADTEMGYFQLALLVKASTQEATSMQLTQEIADSRRRLASLRRMRNSRVPIARIPVEVLTHIFSFVKCHPRWPHIDSARPPAWVAVTHVCHFWREVALSSPLLWSNIVTYNQPWMQETLSRSKTVPISLAIYVQRCTSESPNAIPSIVTHALPHITRAKDITIRGADIAPFVELLFECAAPLLETLELYDTWLHFSLHDETLFLGQASFNLRILRLKRCSFVWPIPVFFSPALTELKISHMLPKDRPSLLQVRAVLSTMPCLRILVLSDVLRKSPNTTAFAEMSTGPTVSTVSLPFLKSLSFATEKAVDVVTFVSQLSVPSNAALHLLCRTLEGFNVREDRSDDSDSRKSGLSYLMLSLVKFFLFDSRPFPEPRDVTKGFRSLGVVKLRGHNQLAPEWCLLVGEHPCNKEKSRLRKDDGRRSSDVDVPVWNTRFLMPFPWQDARHRRHHIKSILHNVCCLLPLSNVDTIIVNCDLYEDAGLWWRTFGPLHNVKSVVVAGRALRGFAAALCGQGQLSSAPNLEGLDDVVQMYRLDDTSSPSRLFPNLCHLTIDNVRFGWEGVIEDLTEGLQRLSQDRGYGPLSSLLITGQPSSRAEAMRRKSLDRFVKRQILVSHGSPVEDATPEWLDSQWGRIVLRDYF